MATLALPLRLVPYVWELIRRILGEDVSLEEAP
jgi:hypothetical protein